MDGVKGALSSKGVWGGILAVVAPLIGYIFHINVTDMDTQQLADLLSSLAAGIGGIVAIIGRITATKRIG